MSQSLRLLLVCFALCLCHPAQAFYDDYDDDEDAEEDGTPLVIRADTPRDRYNAKLDMLNAQVERKRQFCKLSRARGKDYCLKEADQAEREGRYKLAKELEDALAKAGGESK